MCLLITGQAAKVRSTLLDTDGLIADIFGSNPDGLGVMYVNRHGLQRIKSLPKSALEAREFIERLPDDDRQLALHWRWKTHGDIDMENCHPYDIESGVSAMMHNGVLHTGNKADLTKSDTWHFARGYLAGSTPDTLHDSNFAFLLGEFIGDNRFAIMTADGRLTVINEDQGIGHGEVWFSNTYAWSPELLIPGYRSRYRGYKAWAGFSVAGHEDFDYEAWDNWTASSSKAAAKPDAPTTVKSHRDVVIGDKSSPFHGQTVGAVFDAVDVALVDYDVSVLTEAIQSMPCTVLGYIGRNYELEEWHMATQSTMSAGQYENRQYLLERLSAPRADIGEFMELVDEVATGDFPAREVAESIMYYCGFEKRDAEENFHGELQPAVKAGQEAAAASIGDVDQLELALDEAGNVTAGGATEAPDYVG